MTELERNPVGRRFKSIRPGCMRFGQNGECFNWEKNGEPRRDFLWVRFEDGGQQLRRRHEFEQV